MRIKDVVRHELIGIKAKIDDSTNKSQNGIAGRIVDETRHTIKIQARKGARKIWKKNVTLEIEVEDKKIKIKGELLEGRPEERIKAKLRV